MGPTLHATSPLCGLVRWRGLAVPLYKILGPSNNPNPLIHGHKFNGTANVCPNSPIFSNTFFSFFVSAISSLLQERSIYGHLSNQDLLERGLSIVEFQIQSWLLSGFQQWYHPLL